MKALQLKMCLLKFITNLQLQLLVVILFLRMLAEEHKGKVLSACRQVLILHCSSTATMQMGRKSKAI